MSYRGCELHFAPLKKLWLNTTIVCRYLRFFGIESFQGFLGGASGLRPTQYGLGCWVHVFIRGEDLQFWFQPGPALSSKMCSLGARGETICLNSWLANCCLFFGWVVVRPILRVLIAEACSVRKKPISSNPLSSCHPKWLDGFACSEPRLLARMRRLARGWRAQR